jgi:hypothetical protein
MKLFKKATLKKLGEFEAKTITRGQVASGNEPSEKYQAPRS